MISRRSTIGAAAGAALVTPWRALAQQEKLTVIAAHHTSCGPSIRWRGQTETFWRQTPQFKKIDYRRIELASARFLIERSEWAEDMRWVADLFIASSDAEGMRALHTPRFIVASKEQNEMLHTAWGTVGRADSIKPWLDKNVGN